ncbi:MAG TPA: hypothetical protein VMY78_09925 [Solirubrobacteraceae bacterium]|nr:hypothetical protein [Solirubrobacteraceae bacterium]
MALVKDPLTRAQSVKTPLQARRLRDDLEIEIALNTDLPADWEREADKAVDVLNERYGSGELDKLDPEGAGKKGWTPTPSRGAQKGIDNGGAPKRPAPTSTRDASRSSTTSSTGRNGGRRSSPGAGGRPSSRGARRRGGGLFSGKAAEQTGIPSAARSASQLALQALGLMIGLSLAYLILAGTRGRPNAGIKAVERFAQGTSNFVHILVAPVDPLNAVARKRAATAAAAKSRATIAPNAVALAVDPAGTLGVNLSGQRASTVGSKPPVPLRTP